MSAERIHIHSAEQELPLIRDRLDHLARDVAALRDQLASLRKDVEEQAAHRGHKLTEWIKIAVPLLLAGAGAWLTLHNRVAYIEATRITAREFSEEMGNLRGQFSIGPEWMRSAFTKVDTKQDIMREEVLGLKERLIKLESLVK